MWGKAQRAWFYAVGIAGLGRDDVILSSFPKSGNTWVRFFFANLISIAERDRVQVDFGLVNEWMPELGRDNLLRKWPFSTVPRVVKTHKERWPVFAGKRSILVVRDPRDVMVSFRHFELGKKRPRFDGPFSEFVRHPRLGLPGWFRHYESWRPHCGLAVRFEDLKDDDRREFGRMLGHIGLEVPDELFTEAVEKSRFDEIRKVEDQTGNKPGKYREGFRFTRKGTKGDWRTLFSEDDLAYYEALKERHGLEVY